MDRKIARTSFGVKAVFRKRYYRAPFHPNGKVPIERTALKT